MKGVQTMKEPEPNPMVITVTEAAKILGISRPSMYEITERQDFNALVRVGKRKLILFSRLTSWLEKQADNSQGYSL